MSSISLLSIDKYVVDVFQSIQWIIALLCSNAQLHWMFEVARDTWRSSDPVSVPAGKPRACCLGCLGPWPGSSTEKTWGPWLGSKLNASQHCNMAVEKTNRHPGFINRRRVSKLKELIISPFIHHLLEPS